MFAPKWRPALEASIARLPAETRRCADQQLALLDHLSQEMCQLERRILDRTRFTPNLRLLKTLPGVGDILAIVIDREVGMIERFPGPQPFAAYSGTSPKVMASGGKVRFGRMRPEANHYLKWAFIEAANTVARCQVYPHWRQRHVGQLYRRLRTRKGHGVAIGAVARHLAEAAFWVLTRQQPYREPEPKRRPPTQGHARGMTCAP
ncbi:MAG: transposase [Chloroflexota bacterium]